jgi:hypothetical protein
MLVSCAGDPIAVPGPAASVERSEIVAIARAYHEIQWTPSKANALHGRDANGILVHTPDTSLGKHGHRNGWWTEGETMRGMPYQWGGFDTPKTFLEKLREGRAAGDIATYQKRQLDDAAVSRYACGIDCSGLVSRCWRLSRHHSTDEFPKIATQMRSLWQLKPGDILLKPGHVLLVRSWDPRRYGHVLAYEATLHPEWRVNLGSIELESLEEHHYRLWRYRNIKD